MCVCVYLYITHNSHSKIPYVFVALAHFHDMSPVKNVDSNELTHFFFIQIYTYTSYEHLTLMETFVQFFHMVVQLKYHVQLKLHTRRATVSFQMTYRCEIVAFRNMNGSAFIFLLSTIYH